MLLSLQAAAAAQGVNPGCAQHQHQHQQQTCLRIHEVFQLLISDALEVLEGNIMIKLPFVAESASHFRSYDTLSVFACGYALGEGVTQEWVAGRRSSDVGSSMHSHNGTASRSRDDGISTRLLAEGWSRSSAATRQGAAAYEDDEKKTQGAQATRAKNMLLSAKEAEDKSDHDDDLASLVSAMDHPLTGVKLHYKMVEDVSSTNACPSFLACFSLHDAVEWLRMNGWDDKAAQASKRLWAMLEHGVLRYTCLTERSTKSP